MAREGQAAAASIHPRISAGIAEITASVAMCGSTRISMPARPSGQPAVSIASRPGPGAHVRREVLDQPAVAAMSRTAIPHVRSARGANDAALPVSGGLGTHEALPFVA